MTTIIRHSAFAHLGDLVTRSGIMSGSLRSAAVDRFSRPVTASPITRPTGGELCPEPARLRGALVQGHAPANAWAPAIRFGTYKHDPGSHPSPGPAGRH